MTNNLVLGYGKLGKEIVKQGKYDYLCRSEQDFNFCDIRTYYKYLYGYNVIINCIANTDTYSNNKQEMLDTNFKAVCDLVDWCNKWGKKIVQISTDYVYAGSNHPTKETDVPVHAKTWYAYSKLLADGYIESFASDYIIFRTSFKDSPFPYEKAIIYQRGNFDYTPKIASLIVEIINKNAKGIINIGHEESWRMYEMAKETRPDIKLSYDIINENMPHDVSMDVSKMKGLLNL
jgi:dTDP-4-dehydrorhamnose reductase